MPPTTCPCTRRLLERLVLLLVAVLLWQTWCIEGLLFPYCVSGGSMAETLVGLHRDVRCADCGCRFVCGTDRRPVASRAVCPNCGYAENGLDTRPDLAGDRLFLSKSIFRVRPPRRWEVVAFRSPQATDEVQVKRVVGLPGESIQIRHGDVYANNELQRKTLAQQRALAVPVYDANHPPVLDPAPPPRWQGETGNSHWGSADGRFAHPATSERDPIDWLVYVHRQRLAGSEGESREEPITDLCGYNQTQPRREEDVHPVPDVMLSLRLIETFGRGLLFLRAGDGREEFLVQIDPARRRVEVLRKGQPVPGGDGTVPPLDEGISLELSLFDQQFLLAIGGRQCLAWRYESLPEVPQPTSRPLAIGSSGLGVVLHDLRVYRDVYYARPGGSPGRWGLDEPVQLGPDEYYVLGDNSPVSEDSRTWPRRPGLPAELLLGKPLLVHFPAKQVEWGGIKFQVPDPAKIRYIR